MGPPPRRQFLNDPPFSVTKYPVGGLGCVGADAPQSSGKGARSAFDGRIDLGYGSGVDLRQRAIADGAGFRPLDLLDDALEIDGEVQSLVTGMIGPLLELERIVLNARAVLVQTQELTLGDFAAHKCLGAGGFDDIRLVIADLFNNKIGLLYKLLAELAAFATGILIHRGVPDEISDNRVDGFHAEWIVMVDDYGRLQKQKLYA